MNKRIITKILILVVFFVSCSSPKHIHDQASYERQKELKKNRSVNVFGDLGRSLASVFLIAAVNVDLGLIPEGKQFTRLKLINTCADTLYINMLTDVFWDQDNYCDFMDIRIPPFQKCKVLVPFNAAYNIYYSNTMQQEDDVMLQIFTGKQRKLSLTPGLKLESDSLQIN